MIDTQVAEEKFDNFLMIMDDQLEALRDKASQNGIQLDLSPNDFAKLEKLYDLLSAKLNKEEQTSLVVSFARHLGEVVRISYGGKWYLPLDDEKNVNFNTPVIVGHTKIEGLEFAPLSIMRAYALRRKKGTLERALSADIDPQPVNLSKFIVEESKQKT